MNAIDLAWAAGFIDGEGYLGLRDKNLKPTLIVAQSDINPLLKLQAMFGGSIHTQKYMSPRHRPTYYLTINTRQCLNALAKLLPYMRVKNWEASLILTLDYSPHKTNEQYKVEYTKRIEVDRKIKEYHQRGKL